MGGVMPHKIIQVSPFIAHSYQILKTTQQHEIPQCILKCIQQFSDYSTYIKNLENIKMITQNKKRENMETADLSQRLIEKLMLQNQRLIHEMSQYLLQCSQSVYQLTKELLNQNKNSAFKEAITTYLQRHLDTFRYACELYRKDLNKMHKEDNVTFKIAKNFNTCSYTTCNNTSLHKKNALLKTRFIGEALMRTGQKLWKIKNKNEDDLDHCRNTILNAVDSLHRNNNPINKKTDLEILDHSRHHPVVNFFVKIINIVANLFCQPPVNKSKEYLGRQFRFLALPSRNFSQEVKKIEEDLYTTPIALA
jgi:hypothetical protein